LLIKLQPHLVGEEDNLAVLTPAALSVAEEAQKVS